MGREERGRGREIVGTDPFEARFTFAVDGDVLVATVNDDLNVVGITK